MLPYDRLTLIRNRLRARDLRIFRDRVEEYFEQLDQEGDVRGVRAEINRMLPRVVQIVQAADLGGPAAQAVDLLHDIFSDRYARGAYQEILDVLDMAVGVYDANRYAALTRTINPLHYVAAALGFVAGLPRRGLVAFGLLSPRPSRVRPTDLSRFEGVLARIEARFGDMREQQSRHFAESADQLTDLAERMDFLERVLAQQRPAPRLEPGEKKRATPQ